MSSSAPMSAHDAAQTTNLASLIQANDSSIVYPSEDSITALLQGRFRADLPYTRLGSSTLVVVNPLKALANLNDSSAKEYEERSFRPPPEDDDGAILQPHPYDLASRAVLMMRRRGESQSIIYSGITGSGKTFTSSLITSQILRLSSSSSKKAARLSEQIRALHTVLDSFGNAKTSQSPNASRHGRYLELHFTERGRVAAAQILPFALEKSRVTRLAPDERSFHVFYQLLAGATPDERDALRLEDPSSYTLLASSNCYRLPGGPHSDDSIAMDELREAMRVLGFKPKHSSAIFALLAAILLLGNIEFADVGGRDANARIVNQLELDEVARLLGVDSDELEQILVNRTRYIRKDVATFLLTAQAAAAQRDALVRDLYAILYAFVAETANHKVAPAPEDAYPYQIVQLDQPGFHSRAPTSSVYLGGAQQTPLLAAYGASTFTEFHQNFAVELTHSYTLRRTFEDGLGYNALLAADGVALPQIVTMDNSACIELLRGSVLGGAVSGKPGGVLGEMGKACARLKKASADVDLDGQLTAELTQEFAIHASFAANPSSSGAGHLFGINHYAGGCTYDAHGFVERDADIMDAAFVSTFRNSSNAFVAKLFSGPSLSTESHPKDENTIVTAQVSARPLRQPTPIAASLDGTPLPEDAGGPLLDPSRVYPVTTQLNATLTELLGTLDRTRVWNVACIRPNDSGSPNAFDKRRVKAQVRALLLPDTVARLRADYVADYDLEMFCERYVGADGADPALAPRERVLAFTAEQEWTEGLDFVVGERSVWLSYAAWKIVEDEVRVSEKDDGRAATVVADDDESLAERSVYADEKYPPARPASAAKWGNFVPQTGAAATGESAEDLLLGRSGTRGTLVGEERAPLAYGDGGVHSPTLDKRPGGGSGAWGDAWGDDKGGMGGGPPPTDIIVKEKGPGGLAALEERPVSRTRRIWVGFVWALTWWIPSFLLSSVGGMKRPDIRLAWREKLTLVMLILLFCGVVLFYIIVFGKLLCPRFDKAWSEGEVGSHTSDSDFWVALHGEVYDISSFWRSDHSDITSRPASNDLMKQLAGLDLTDYFPVPKTWGCEGLATDQVPEDYNSQTQLEVQTAEHEVGGSATEGSKLANADWYQATFLPKMKGFHKGSFVLDKGNVESDGYNGTKQWAIWNGGVYDLTVYLSTLDYHKSDSPNYAEFLNGEVSSLFKQSSGQDISKDLNAVLNGMSEDQAQLHKQCLQRVYYRGDVDFRDSARCQVQNYLLLSFTILLCVTILVKFLAALQLGSKRRPELQDKFIICQVPCYTEGEESLKKTIDSLAALEYDDKRKLIFLICDGNIIGGGNDRPTPRIALDILGVDPALDPEPLLFKSVAEGGKQLNYGKVYSGLYEFEGHVVPYMVVVKVGKPSERSRPGNRGKRDSQILLMRYLNRVHFDAPMCPLELEIYHQMRNVIGIDPAFYEYIFMVDADTTVTPESVNRLTAACADDSKIIGICGETKLENEEGSWWTMIQVYEYFISHHLAKAFESLFGTVTCLPGCFSMYRIRTADRGRPLIISSRIIEDYSENNVDTLHKKNLLWLGEDRYLTTIMLKHFPTFKMKFTPDAIAHTAAPDTWAILISQRRRWINSTVHNLFELAHLPDMCGFCCFSMRFFVMIDLIGTVMLPATVIYLIYLIVICVTENREVPIITLAVLGATYGFQIIIFLLKRQWQYIGWMIIYLVSYPIWSFLLPLYSFWHFDDFSWGSTRVVIGESGTKKIIATDDEPFSDEMIPLKKFSEYEAEVLLDTSRVPSDDGSDSPFAAGTPTRSVYAGSTYAGSQRGNPFAGGSPYAGSTYGGDYYQNKANAMPGARSNASLNAFSQSGHGLPPPSLGQHWGGSQAGSDYGGGGGAPGLGPYGMMGGPGSFGPAASQYGFGPRASVATDLNFAGGPGSLHPGMGMARPTSTFSIATTANPFATSAPNLTSDPTSEQLLSALRQYLATTSLMQVTKRTAREAVAAKFPNAQLDDKKDFLNSSIDAILENRL